MMLNGELEKAPASMQMCMGNEPVIPVQVKYIEAQSATILKNPKTTLRIRKPQEQERELLLNSEVYPSARCPEELPDPSLSPRSPPTTASEINSTTPNKFQFDPNLSYAEKVAHEMIITEKIYLDNLKQIIDGFLDPVSNHPNLDISQQNIDDLFINVKEIYNFNWILLKDMLECNHDPVKLAECFVVKQTGFGVYTRYCTHYPRSMEVLMEWNQREDTASFIKKQQEALGHTLPLCSFLLKPVQRILKYHLLLGNIAKHYKQSEDEEGFQIIQKALSAMTNVAKHIDNMKRKHEDAVHLQEIQSVLVEYEGPNLTTFGSLVLEDTFRLHGTKTDRYLFLFKKALLITKRRNDGTFTWKATIMHSNMMLADSVFREPLTFQVFPFDDRKMSQYTFVARNMDIKQTWLLELKLRLLDSYDAAVPMKAKQIILGNSGKEYEKENAEPESGHKLVSNGDTRKGANQQRSTKDNGGQSNKLKVKEIEEISEEKSRASIDLIKSPLRRKLRVFKKRKFSKDLGKSPKRVSWSSDDNIEELCGGGMSEPVDTNEGLENQNVTTPNSQIPPSSNGESDSKLLQNIEEKNTEKDVSVVSLPHDGIPLFAVSVEEISYSSEHLDLPETTQRGEGLPIKKRRLAKGNREKSKSMPVGGLMYDDDEGERTFQGNRTQSLLNLQLTEEHLSDLVSANVLQNKYGLVNLRENAAKIRSRRSSDGGEQMGFDEGCVRGVNSHVDNTRDDMMSNDAMSTLADDTKVTMRCVSAAFSDISPSFSPEKTPTSSTEQLINPDVDVAMFEEQGLHDEVFDDLPLRENETEKSDTKLEYLNNHRDTRNEENEAAVRGHLQVTGDGASPSNEDSYENQESNKDKSSTLLSERSSYGDTFDSCDDQDEDSLITNIHDNETSQKVFILKRAYSEENLVSKSSLNEAECHSSSTVNITSKSCTHFDQKHSPIARSRSIGSASACRSPNSQPFTFSVTSKKKIVIKDSFWETIKEYPERSSLERDGQTVRRRIKRRTSHKSNRNTRNCLSSGDAASYHDDEPQRTCVSLDIGDYRKVKEEKRGNHSTDTLGVSGMKEHQNRADAARRGDTQLELGQGITERSVTTVEVALKRRSDVSKRKKSVVRVDENVSEAPRNYLCVETFPSDEDDQHSVTNNVTNDELTDQALEDCGKLDAARSKVEKLSKYFSQFKPEDNMDRCNKSSDAVQNVSNIKKRIEELKRKENSIERAPLIPDGNAVVSKELNLQHISDRIDELQRSNGDEKQTSRKLQNNVAQGAHVKRLKSLIEDTNEVELGKQLQSKLRIKDRVDEIENLDGNENADNCKLEKRVDELHGCQHIKDRIDRLRKGKDKVVDSGRDITISDENETTECVMSPRRNEEHRTVVIKRGWVQQFVQKIETSS